MKRIIISAISLLMALQSAYSQKPTTTYPYLYPQFLDGTVVLEGGKREARKLNVQIRRDALHYLDNEIVKEAFLKDVIAVEIGDDVFVPVFGEMMKVVARNDNGCVAAEILGNFESARESGGAYGTSSTTSATMKLTSIQTDNEVNQNHMNLLNEREQGMEVKLITKYYIVTPSIKVRASKKDIEDSLPAEKADGWKEFLRNTKIKWNKPESILMVVDYLK